MDTNHLSEVSFDQFDLPEPVRQGIKAAGFSQCTPIQARTLPLALAGQDVAGQAQTGTGKTAAFVIAVLNHLLRHAPNPKRRANQPRALIVAPTRELAVQIHRDAEGLAQYTGLRMGVVYGGTGYDEQRNMLTEGVDILIGTPGRLIDYYKQHIFDLRAVQAAVIDEADRMFDLGFIRDLRYMFRQLPPPAQRLSMLFSATLSLRVIELAYEHMNNPQLVKIESEKITAERVTECLYHTASEEKISLLLGLLAQGDPKRSIVFVNTKRAAEQVHGALIANGIESAILSGDVPQQKRMSLLACFQRGELPVLVATDVAARGLHIPAVSHVFNFDLPQDAEDYVHRVGRTARAGATGDAVSFACEEYAFSLPEIETFIGHKIPVERITDDLLVVAQPSARSDDSRRRPPANRARTPQRGGRPAGRPSSGKRRS